MMKTYLFFSFIQLYCICRCTSIEIKPELKRNILNFGYSINYKYEGMLAHSFNRFYVVTKFILLCIQDLKFSYLNYDDTCTYLNDKNSYGAETKKYILDLLIICKKIEPYEKCYKKQIKSYDDTAHNILENEVNSILPQMPLKHKCGIITTLVSSFLGLAYEGISSFLHIKKTQSS